MNGARSQPAHRVPDPEARDQAPGHAGAHCHPATRGRTGPALASTAARPARVPQQRGRTVRRKQQLPPPRPPWHGGPAGTPDPPVGQAGQEPRLPGRPRPVQAASAQLLTRRQKLRLARRGGEREGTHVISDVERRGVHPQRPAQARRGPVQQLPEMRHQVQPRLDDPADSLNPEPAVTVHQAGPVQEAECADIPGASRHRLPSPRPDPARPAVPIRSPPLYLPVTARAKALPGPEVPRLCRYRRPAGHRGQAHATASWAKQPRSGRSACRRSCSRRRCQPRRCGRAWFELLGAQSVRHGMSFPAWHCEQPDGRRADWWSQ